MIYKHMLIPLYAIDPQLFTIFSSRPDSQRQDAS